MIQEWRPSKHPREDAFEDYAFDRLEGNAAIEFEEHLLVCEECQNALEKTDEYIRVMKAATAAYVSAQFRTTPAKTLRSRYRLPWNVAAAAILLLTCLTALLSWRTSMGDAQTVALEAYRNDATSRAVAGRPIDLAIDLKDVQPAAGYRVEVVDATGRKVWFGGTPAHLANGLARGDYWVRLLTDTGESLREFKLKVG